MENYLGILPVNSILFTIFFTMLALIGVLVTRRVIDLIFSQLKGTVSSQRLVAKTRTIRSLLKHGANVAILGIYVLMVLAHWGVNITPLLTGAGILGLAVSFGRQTLIKDIIAGFFIIIENQFNVGDTITIKDTTGEVVAITLRITKLKDKKENMIFIPNSEISFVTRHKAA